MRVGVDASRDMEAHSGIGILWCACPALPAQESISRVQTNESKTDRATCRVMSGEVCGEFLPWQELQRISGLAYSRTKWRASSALASLEPPPARHGHRYWPLKGSAAFPAMKRVRNPKDVILIPITFTCTSMMAMLRTCLVWWLNPMFHYCWCSNRIAPTTQ